MRHLRHTHLLQDRLPQRFTKPQWASLLGRNGMIEIFTEFFSGPNRIEGLPPVITCNLDKA